MTKVSCPFFDRVEEADVAQRAPSLQPAKALPAIIHRDGPSKGLQQKDFRAARR